MERRQGGSGFGPMWWAFTSAAAAAGAFYVGWRDGDRQAYALGGVFAVATLGLLGGQNWAKRLCAVAYLVPAGAFCYQLAAEGPRAGWLAAAVGLIVCAWIVWCADLTRREDGPVAKTKPASEPEPVPNRPILSLVALLPEPQYLDAAILARLAGTAWKAYIGTEEHEDPDACVVGDAPHFLLTHQGRLFAIHHFDRPYWDDMEAAAAEASDGPARHALRRHRACLSVDRIGDDLDAVERRQSYRLIGKLLAELIDADCLAVYVPETRTLHPYHDDVPACLRSDDPPGRLSRTPPPRLPADDDPRLQAAVGEARRRWPEFVAAFENRVPEQTFAAKVSLRSGGQTEFVWLNVTALEGDAIFGTLANQPIHLPHKLDDRARAPVADLHDWIYQRGDQTCGGFTTAVLKGAAEIRRSRI